MVISSDSFVAASSSVSVSGLANEVGARLAVPQGVFLNAGDLLQETCAARGVGEQSSFTAMGRGGLPPDPAGPLAAPYRKLEDARGGSTEPVGSTRDRPRAGPPALQVTAANCGPVPRS